MVAEERALSLLAAALAAALTAALAATLTAALATTFVAALLTAALVLQGVAIRYKRNQRLTKPYQ